MMHSLPSSSSGTLCTHSAVPRVSTSRITCFVKSGDGVGGARRRSRFSPLLYCASELRGTAEILHHENKSSAKHDVSSRRTFLDARTKQDLLLGIQKETEAGRLPTNVAQGMEELIRNYQTAAEILRMNYILPSMGPQFASSVLQSGHPQAHEIIVSNMAVVLDRIFMDVLDPFQFSPHHEAIREPFDYYMFGQKYIGPLVDFRNSFLGNVSVFSEMEKKLHQGENIILISNHQTEADPAVMSWLLETSNPFIAENMICVAGDRVVTDPLCKPFSMGRNLLCVYSKKHLNDDPDLIDMKKRANTKSLKEMALLLRGGSKVIWIAPSGGRDRPKPNTKEWYPAPFDASAVDNMRRLTEHAGVPGHLYPLAVLCYNIMPPPAQVEKEIGEKREISFHGVGLSAAPSISYHEVASAYEDPEKAKLAYTQAVYSSVVNQYNVLKSAIHGKQGLNASIPSVSLSQPWAVDHF